MINELDKQILEYLPLLENEEKQSLVSLIKSFLHSKDQTLLRTSIEQYNKELDDAEREFEKGDYVTHEEMLKEIRKW